jgi:nucleotide-binding universal stress UspA family protein
MIRVFEYAVSMAAYSQAELVILHVMEDPGAGSERQANLAFGQALYQELKDRKKAGARNILINKNSDALRIRQAITDFFQENSDNPDAESALEKIIVSESSSIANEIVSTAALEKCDVIVMGCKQQGLIAGAMGDKLVRKVLKRTSVPVFVVPVS